MQFLTITALFVAAAAALPGPPAVNQCAAVPKGTKCVAGDFEGTEYDGVCVEVPGFPNACFPTGPFKTEDGHHKRQTRNDCHYLGEKCIIGEVSGLEAVGECRTFKDHDKEYYFCSPI